jgi:hypothetical protein
MKLYISIITVLVILSSCKKNQENEATLSLSINGLEDLGTNARYEGWLLVNGNPVTTGTFTVNASGQFSQKDFTVEKTSLQNATAFVLTIEPFPDTDPAPSPQHLLAGDFNATNANLTIGHPAALNTNFSSATGKYVLATPTTTITTDELSGLWFLNLSSGSPAAGLSLPTLPTGWKYEGWALINGKPVTTGTFNSGTGADAGAPFSGAAMAPPFPGEDFILNAPSGLSFPTNLSGGLAVVSVEPFPDNSPAPFLLKPLAATIPNPATDHITYNMMLNSGSFPSGLATR